MAAKRVSTSFALPPDLVRDLRQLADDENRSTSRQAELAIRSYLAAYRKTEAAR